MQKLQSKMKDHLGGRGGGDKENKNTAASSISPSKLAKVAAGGAGAGAGAPITERLNELMVNGKTLEKFYRPSPSASSFRASLVLNKDQIYMLDRTAATTEDESTAKNSTATNSAAANSKRSAISSNASSKPQIPVDLQKIMGKK